MKKMKTIRYPGRKIFNTLHGFTLVELMTVVAIIVILAAFAAPEVINWRPKMRVKGAADTLSENMQRAKMHAIKNNVSVVFTFAAGTGAPARTCTGGNYSFVDNAVPPIVVASETFNDLTTPESTARTSGLCLQASTFAVGDGFTPRGLSLVAGGGVVTLSNASLAAANDPTYVVTQTVAGGIQLQKVLYP